jgi:transcription-repair coupling factor (superfamily II helicase)
MSTYSPLHPPVAQEKDNKLNWGNLSQIGESLAIAKFAEQAQNCSLIITSNIHEANRLRRELQFFLSDAEFPLLHFPDWETLAFDQFSPHEDIISQRLFVLYQLQHLKKGIVIVALPTLLQYILPKYYLGAHVFLLEKNQTLNLESLNRQLVDAGYHRVDQVRAHGEFAVRGSIWDVFPTGTDTPFRIELFDNEIDSIRMFDPETQISTEQVESIQLLPAREYPLTDEAITHFRQQFRSQFSGNPRDCPIYEAVSNGEPFPGCEYYLPLFYDKLTTFFDYIPEETTVFTDSGITVKLDELWTGIENRYEQLRYDLSRPLCKPSQIFLSKDDFFAKLKSFQQIKVNKDPLDNKQGNSNFSLKSIPDITIQSKQKVPLKNLGAFANQQAKILFTAESSGRRETLLDLLKDINITPKGINTWDEFIQAQNGAYLSVAPLDNGFILDDPALCLIPESELFGEQVMQRRLRKRQQADAANMIHSLSELKIGAPVVHLEHGIAKYQGLKIIQTDSVQAEYLNLEYADGDRIYVPISSLHLISRYSGIDSGHVHFNKLGNDRWSKTKSTAIKQIRDTAAELLKLYSERAASKGFAFPQPGAEYNQFRRSFPFEETPDQEITIDNVIHDMSKQQSMDRLVCGDVGFGKTEVAMQAAFHAAINNKQVALLSPTTLLAEQHYNNFKDRFADWPIKIGILSRLQTKKNQDEVLQGLKNGKVDIVIGTHKLLQDDIKFKNLGLLIIDEEHRFGVRQKEKIRSLRATVDLLALTATPIPRTLNMALGGIRDLSIISTPPLKRLSIKTFLYENNDAIMREAITREIMRGGQVYFLHNDVATIKATAEKLAAIVPEARIGIAHGQMRERELEHVMSDFYHQRFNVLVCTTIIESGIDIPSANTIIIDRADKFGLSQLHQIRGRVGRSHHQAYAYLLVPDKNILTNDAKKRLDAITTFDDLGAGFMLATHDLEIRGSGELLGEGQSGHMEVIGYSLYMELLEEAVKALKEGRDPDFHIEGDGSSVEVDFHVSSLLPNTYIPDVGIRLSLYKRLSQAQNSDDIHQFKAELIDRFGTLPVETEHLLRATEVKLLAKQAGITKVDIHKEFFYLHFGSKPNIDMKKLIELIQKQPESHQLQGQTTLRSSFSGTTLEQYIQQTKTLISNLTIS